MAGLLSLFQRKKETVFCSAVIVAAGLSQRMEGIDKMLAPLGELPVLVHTLYAFQDCDCVQEIVVVTREDLLVEVGRLCREFDLDKVTKVVVGGETRTLSVWAGIQETSPGATHIAIHDGARPLTPQAVIAETIRQAVQTGAAAPAVPVTDTLKREENSLSLETVDRENLRAIQTPQVFESGLIRAAIQKAADDRETLTDDCAAVERLGMKVVLTRGSRENIKITTPLDLIFGEAILTARAKGELE